MIKNNKAKIISNIPKTSRYYKMILKTAEICATCRPGQFVHVRVSEQAVPLLRRPFSIHSVKLDTLEILYEVVGEGTRLLSLKGPGETLDIIGPLGNGFQIIASKAPKGAQDNFIVAGGIGVAPLFFLAEDLKRAGLNADVFLGVKSKDNLVCAEEFKELGFKMNIASNDGSVGFKGYVTELFFKKVFRIKQKKKTVIYACGPKPMLKELTRICKPDNFIIHVSLDEFMGCGLGACLGCVIKVKSQKSPPEAGPPSAEKVKNSFKYKRVCTDGPVFDAREIVW
ncbi:MAG: dihydroorotate dehydrogenase electron transfer subunit [Candidatus Omnitrophota bacterium]